jgi:hypothetical protein
MVSDDPEYAYQRLAEEGGGEDEGRKSEEAAKGVEDR